MRNCRLYKDKNFFNEKILSTLNLMRRRGPDNQSLKIEHKSCDINLLHSRLNKDLHPNQSTF